MKALVCTQEQFESLHSDLAKVRQGSEHVKVNKEALRLLLEDHAYLVGEVERSGDKPND